MTLFPNSQSCRCIQYVLHFVNADPPEYVIKRVIALEGDEVETSAASSVVLKRGAAWVEGDNALNSIDSNTYGPICLGLVVGKASHVVWPPGHLFLKALSVYVYYRFNLHGPTVPTSRNM